jgi:hypothetical protein
MSPYQFGDDKRTFYYLGAREVKSRKGRRREAYEASLAPQAARQLNASSRVYD